MVTYHPPDFDFPSETTGPRPRPRPRQNTTTTKTKKWDPVTVLEILNPDPGYNCITCLGLARTASRRCRNPINRANRTYILKTLDEISYLDPGSPAVEARLEEIAGTCMCIRWHQNQAESILSEWRAEISKLVGNSPQSTKSEPRDVPAESFVKREESVKEAWTLEDLMRKFCEIESRLEKLNQEREEQHTWRQQSPTKPKPKKSIVKEEDEIPSQKWEEVDRFMRRQERLERQRQEKARKERERQEEEERLERERERREKERLAKEKQEQERERQEKEKARRAREEDTATRNERIRTRAQQKRLEAERLRLEKEESEKREWEASWSTYQARWTSFKSHPGTTRPRDIIPWPVQSGLYRDVQASNVQTFFENTILKKGGESESVVAKELRKECVKWHPDARKRLPGWTELTDTDHMVMDMICTRLTSLMDRAARKSSECPG